MKFKPARGYLFIKLLDKLGGSNELRLLKAEVVRSYENDFGHSKYEEGTKVLIPFDSLLATHNEGYNSEGEVFVIDEQGIMGIDEDSSDADKDRDY